MKFEKTLELTEHKALNNESRNAVPLLGGRYTTQTETLQEPTWTVIMIHSKLELPIKIILWGKL